MIVFDGLPLCNAHRQRGIGYYVRGVLRSLELASTPSLPTVQILTRRNPSIASSFLPLQTWRPSWPNVRLSWAFNAALVPYDFRHSRNARLFHATDPNGLCRPTHLSMLATAYDLAPLRFPADYLDKFPRDTRVGYFRMLKRYRSAEHIVAISNYTRNDFIDMLGIPTERISVIYPGIDIQEIRDRFQPGLSSTLQTPARFFLYVGAIEPRKNIDFMLEAYSRVAETIEEDFVLAGHVSATQRDSTLALAAKLGVSARVRLLGMVSDRKLGLLYSRATAMVFVSKFEGFGLPVLEAMALGCPVICSDAAALSEIAPGAAHVVPLENISTLSLALTQVAGDEKYRLSLVECGSKRASSFNLYSAGQSFFELYQHLFS